MWEKRRNVSVWEEKNGNSLWIKKFQTKSNNEKKKEQLWRQLWRMHKLCMAGKTYRQRGHKWWGRIFRLSHSHEKVAIYDVIKHAKSKNALYVEKKDVDYWLRIVKNIRTTNILTDSDIAHAVLNRSADNASSNSEEKKGTTGRKKYEYICQRNVNSSYELTSYTCFIFLYMLYRISEIKFFICIKKKLLNNSDVSESKIYKKFQKIWQTTMYIILYKRN